MGAKRSFSAFLSLSMAAFGAGLSCRAAKAAGVESAPEEALGALNSPASAAETLGAASMNMPNLDVSNVRPNGEDYSIPPLVAEPRQMATPVAQTPVAAQQAQRQAAPGPMKAAKAIIGRLKAFIKSGISGASKTQGIDGQVAQGRTSFDAAARNPGDSSAVDAGAPEAAAQGPSLQAAAPSAEEGVPVAVPPSVNSLDIFSGTWRKVSGNGPDLIRLSVKGGQVQYRWGGSHFDYGYDFSNINGPTVVDAPWRGNFLAPGGTVTGETTTAFENGKLVTRHIRTETHLIRIPERLVTTKSLEIQGNRLVHTEEAVLYRRLFFYFGPYSVRTSFNTTNIASPVSYKSTTVYERIVTAK